MLALSNKNSEFTGVKTVNIYSIPTAPMGNYTRSGSNRYGTPNDLTRNVQTKTITRDRAFTFIIDKGDKTQSQMVSDAGKALSRQIREVCVPEYDAYVFKTLANAATGTDDTAASKANAYELFLAAMERLGNKNVPDKGRVCFCTYRFANFLKQDPAFMRYGDKSQEMLIKGVMGEVDGCRIVKVPSSRLPSGAAFLLTHPVAATAPKQLEDFKIHDDPPGLSGWLVEGRLLYDCFTFDEKEDAIYYQSGAADVRDLAVLTAATAAGKTTLQVNAELEGSKRYYMTAATRKALTEVTYGTAISTAAWTELTGNGVELTPTSGHKFVRVVEVDGSSKPLAVGDARINIG